MDYIRKSSHPMVAHYSFAETSDLSVIKPKYVYVKNAYMKNEVRESLNSKMVSFFRRRTRDL